LAKGLATKKSPMRSTSPNTVSQHHGGFLYRLAEPANRFCTDIESLLAGDDFILKLDGTWRANKVQFFEKCFQGVEGVVNSIFSSEAVVALFHGSFLLYRAPHNPLPTR
jgi:hypothetical protein